MTIEKQIEKALKINSHWRGSADLLWEQISTRLKPKPPWWQKRGFWLGTAVAALVLLSFFLGSIKSPLLPGFESLDRDSQLRSISAPDQPEPLAVARGDLVHLFLQVYPREATKVREPVILTIERLEQNRELSLLEEIVLDLEILGEISEERTDFVLPIRVPQERGSYQIQVQGTFWQGETFYQVQGQIPVEVR